MNLVTTRCVVIVSAYTKFGGMCSVGACFSFSVQRRATGAADRASAKHALLDPLGPRLCEHDIMSNEKPTKARTACITPESHRRLPVFAVGIVLLSIAETSISRFVREVTYCALIIYSSGQHAEI
jgi:hypothetical protein